MSFPTIKYAVASRENHPAQAPFPGFIIWEVTSPAGHSRYTMEGVQVHPYVKIGDPITSTGAPAKPDGTDFYGLSLVQLSPTTGLHTNGDVYASVLFRDADVKDNPKFTDELKIAMAKVGIDVTTTGE